MCLNVYKTVTVKKFIDFQQINYEHDVYWKQVIDVVCIYLYFQQKNYEYPVD